MTGTVYIGPWDRDISEGFIGAGFYVRRHGPFQAGGGVDGHRHNIDHITFVKTGRVRIEWGLDGKTGTLIVDAPNFILVPADAEHHITAEVDGAEWCCLFSEHEAMHVGQADPMIGAFNQERRQ